MKKSIFFLMIIVLLSLSFVQAQGYLTFGRNPCVPGGLTNSNLDSNSKFMVTDKDYYITMKGGSGEVVSGWMKAGTTCKWIRISQTEWQAVAIKVCGNPILNKIVYQEKIVQQQQPPQQIVVNVNITQPQQQFAYPTVIPCSQPTNGWYVSTVQYCVGYGYAYRMIKPGDINVNNTWTGGNNTAIGGAGGIGGTATNTNNNVANGGNGGAGGNATNNITNTNNNINQNQNINSQNTTANH